MSSTPSISRVVPSTSRLAVLRSGFRPSTSLKAGSADSHPTRENRARRGPRDSCSASPRSFSACPERLRAQRGRSRRARRDSSSNLSESAILLRIIVQEILPLRQAQGQDFACGLLLGFTSLTPAGRLKFIIGAESGGGRRVPKTFFCCWCGYACERDRFLCSFHGGVRAVWRPAVRAIAGGKGYARSSGEGSEQASTGRYPARY